MGNLPSTHEKYRALAMLEELRCYMLEEALKSKERTRTCQKKPDDLPNMTKNTAIH